MDYDRTIKIKGGKTVARRKNNTILDTFREQLGDKDIEIDDYKVDDLRKMASAFDISGSHDMNKQELVNTLNKARRNGVT